MAASLAERPIIIGYGPVTAPVVRHTAILSPAEPIDLARYPFSGPPVVWRHVPFWAGLLDLRQVWAAGKPDKL